MATRVAKTATKREKRRVSAARTAPNSMTAEEELRRLRRLRAETDVRIKHLEGNLPRDEPADRVTIERHADDPVTKDQLAELMAMAEDNHPHLAMIERHKDDTDLPELIAKRTRRGCV